MPFENVPKGTGRGAWPAPPSKLKSRLKQAKAAPDLFTALGSVNATALLRLQRSIGNQAIKRMLSNYTAAKPRLDAFAPLPDPAAQEADRDEVITAGLRMELHYDGDQLPDMPPPDTVVRMTLRGYEGPGGTGILPSQARGETTARHSTANDALLRSLELDFSGKTVAQLKAMPGYKPHPEGFQASLFDMVKRQWEFMQYQTGQGAQQSRARAKGPAIRRNGEDEEENEPFSDLFGGE